MNDAALILFLLLFLAIGVILGFSFPTHVTPESYRSCWELCKPNEGVEHISESVLSNEVCMCNNGLSKFIMEGNQ